MEADFSGIFRADFKILASLELQSGDARVEWCHLILRIRHLSKLPYERQHWIFLPILEQTLRGSGWIFLEMIVIRVIDVTSFATCLHTVLVAVDTLFPDPADRFLDVGDAH